LRRIRFPWSRICRSEFYRRPVAGLAADPQKAPLHRAVELQRLRACRGLGSDRGRGDFPALATALSAVPGSSLPRPWSPELPAPVPVQARSVAMVLGLLLVPADCRPPVLLLGFRSTFAASNLIGGQIRGTLR
jgi:hypothetical protein